MRRRYMKEETNYQRSERLRGAIGSEAYVRPWQRGTKLPQGFTVKATSENAPFAIASDEERRIFTTMFHPEVVHTPDGGKLIANFVHRVAGLKSDWTMAAFRQEAVAAIRDGMRRAPDWPAAKFDPAGLYPRPELFDPDLERLKAALAAKPDDPALLFLSGYQLWFLGDRKEAVKLFQRASARTKENAIIERFLLETVG